MHIRVGSPDSVGQFLQADTRGRHVDIYHYGNIYLGTDDVAPLSVYEVPVARLPQTKREAAGACHGNITTHFVASIHLEFIGINAIKFLQYENIFKLTEALRYHKQLSTSLIAVGDIIIGKSLDINLWSRGT